MLYESRVFVLLNCIKSKAIGQRMIELCGHESGWYLTGKIVTSLLLKLVRSSKKVG